MLEPDLKNQLKSLFADLQADYIFDVTVAPQHEKREELLEMLRDVAACSNKISCQVRDGNLLKFSLLKNEIETGISFRAIPGGHEFTSLLLAILNCDGKGKNMPDENIRNRVKALKGKNHLTTYISLSCPNCPDVVQALNIMAIWNPNMTHEMVDGAIYQEEVEALKIQGVPAVFADGKWIHSGKSDFGELLVKLEAHYGTDHKKLETTTRHYDMIVAGGGPAGAAAAIYSARKGLKVAVVAERTGGQVNETTEIENLISIDRTTGTALAADLKRQMLNNNVDLFEHRHIEKAEIEGKEKIVTATGGEKFIAPALVIATGASWRKLNVPGEAEHIGRGVAFCPHCDGPFYKNQHVAVVGGGNSGIEAAIDLAGICSKVTVFEFLDKLKADKVLQSKVKTFSHVEIFTNMQILEIIGTGEKVTAVRFKNRETGIESTMDLNGVFVQIGLMANSSVFKDLVKTNVCGEIEIDTHGRSSQYGIYAAGDVSNVPYKQIIISMGEGAKAALSAFEDRIRE